MDWIIWFVLHYPLFINNKLYYGKKPRGKGLNKGLCMYINWPYGGLLKKAISGVPARLSHVAFAVASVSRYYYSDQGRTVLQRLYGPWTAAALFLRPCTESSIFDTLVEFSAWIHIKSTKVPKDLWIKSWTVLQRLYGPWTAAALFLRPCTKSSILTTLVEF